MPLPNIIEFIGTNITQRKFQEAQEKLLSYLGIEVPTKTELNSEISKLNNAITPKADKIYVDSALSSFQNGALKTYPTLAAANADIANITLNTKVEVLSVTEGGSYYKATAGATTLTKSAYDPLTQAKADATIKASAAEANAKNFSKQLNKDSLKQGEVQQPGIGLLLTDRRGIPNWFQADEQGMPTESTKGVITNFLNNRLLHQIQNNVSGFVISDRRGFAVFGPENYSQSASSKYDLSTVKFHGSSTMRFMQDELFTKLKNQFSKIQNALYTNRNSGGTINDLATEIGINDGLLKFTDNKIYAASASPVAGSGLKYGLPTTYDISITLTNGLHGTLKAPGFIANNLSSDFDLPENIEIAFKSDVTDRANCVAVVNLGKNNMSGSNTVVVNNIVGMTRDAVAFLDKENGGHTLVIGHTTNRGSSADFVKNVKDVNAQLKALYFKRYFGLFDYIFSEQIWLDTGLTKSSDDISAIAAETLPPSLTDDGIHLNASANSAVTTQIVQFIQTLGWY